MKKFNTVLCSTFFLLLLTGSNSSNAKQKSKQNKTVQKNQKNVSKKNSNSDGNIATKVSIYGRWKCISTDYRGYQKFSIAQANKIKNSYLIIEKNKMYYEGLNFIELCKYATLKKERYDTTEYGGASLNLNTIKLNLLK